MARASCGSAWRDRRLPGIAAFQVDVPPRNAVVDDDVVGANLRIRLPNRRDNANFGAGTGRSEALCLATSAIIQEMFILTRVLCSAGGDRVESDAGSKKFVDPLGVSGRDIGAGGTFEPGRRASAGKAHR